MCNATVALEIASRALGFHGEVIVPSFTFVATAHALYWQGVLPVFADIDPATHNIDARKIEHLITERTTGIVAVHVWGRPCNISAIEEVANKYGLPVMYDAAHAFACSHEGKMIGGFGACEVFSFHATKFVNSFEGGAVVTNDDELAAKLRLMRNFGFKGFDNVAYIGVNGKMTEVCAAMGLTSLEAVDDITTVNKRNYDAYSGYLADIRGLSLIEYNHTERNNWQYVVVEVDAAQAGVDRDVIVNALHAENIIARKYFWPGCHRMEPYVTIDPHAGRDLPCTESVAAKIMVLPTGQQVDDQIVKRVCSVIRAAIR
jgi:dTDP-4-amino-4,6-dideoxygalactose transaminase